MKNRYKYFNCILTILFIFASFKSVFAQDLDVEDTLDRLERIEKNISDLQRGIVKDSDKSVSSGYISRTEFRLDEIETKNRLNFGIIEEIQNKIDDLDRKIELLNTEFQSRLISIEDKLKNIKASETFDSQEQITKKEQETIFQKPDVIKSLDSKVDNTNTNLSESEIKKKYENAIKLLWASKYKKAEEELMQLKKIEPEDLMPNIQYWIGEVHYAQQNFEKAIIAFGEGLKNYPESIKGPDNLLKLGLSFSNLKKKNEACNVLYELRIKYENAPKNVLERASSEIKKLDCPEE
jgi:tol-pal system protein YbgF